MAIRNCGKRLLRLIRGAMNPQRQRETRAQSATGGVAVRALNIRGRVDRVPGLNVHDGHTHELASADTLAA